MSISTILLYCGIFAAAVLYICIGSSIIHELGHYLAIYIVHAFSDCPSRRIKSAIHLEPLAAGENPFTSSTFFDWLVATKEQKNSQRMISLIAHAGVCAELLVYPMAYYVISIMASPVAGIAFSLCGICVCLFKFFSGRDRSDKQSDYWLIKNPAGFLNKRKYR